MGYQNVNSFRVRLDLLCLLIFVGWNNTEMFCFCWIEKGMEPGRGSLNLLMDSDGHKITIIPPTLSNIDNARRLVEEWTTTEWEGPVVLSDVGQLFHKYDEWNTLMPTISPFYALKCNNDPILIGIMAKLDIGFDCASENELRLCTSYGVSSERIIFANPCKTMRGLRVAKELNVKLMTFDSDYELLKIKQIFPDAEYIKVIISFPSSAPSSRLVLRFGSVSDTSAVLSVGEIFGCSLEEAKGLIELSCSENMNLVGVSFHLGSGLSTPRLYYDALRDARVLYDFALNCGVKMTIVNIGGGMPGVDMPTFTMNQFAKQIKDAVEEFFPPSLEIRMMAEPGRYYASSCFHEVVKVNGCRKVSRSQVVADYLPALINDDKKTTAMMYYINDGIFGNFKPRCHDHKDGVPPIVLDKEIASMPYDYSKVWGPTCAAFDLLHDHVLLPQLQCGDWLMYENCGHYSTVCSTKFNMIEQSTIHYFIRSDMVQRYRALMCKAKQNGIE